MTGSYYRALRRATHTAIVSALDDVHRQSSNLEARFAWHERDYITELLPLLKGSVPGSVRGMAFNRTDAAAFRSLLTKAGYYKQWKETYGPETWGILEKYTGPMA